MLLREGARFVPGCSGSAVWSGHTPINTVHNLPDTTGTTTFQQQLKSIGYLGNSLANYSSNPLSCHFELHIEQQRRLQDAGKSIGVVTDIQGVRWYRATVLGSRAHAGSTPMADRTDAMVVTSKMVTFLDEVARDTAAVATVGVVELDRPSSNTVPGQVNFTIDIRHRSESTLNHIEEAVLGMANSLMYDNAKLKIELSRIWRSPAVQLDPKAVSCTRLTAQRLLGEAAVMDTISLAGHDSALTATRIPTSMIFVPSKDGVSHAPNEFTSKEDWYVLSIIYPRYNTEDTKSPSTLQ